MTQSARVEIGLPHLSGQVHHLQDMTNFKANHPEAAAS